MSDIEIDFTSDWHLGHPNAGKDYPKIEDIQESLDSALARGVAAYVVAGDFINQGQVQNAHIAASLLKPYIEKGLNVIGIVGNHDFIDDSNSESTSILANAGVKMLEGNSCVVRSKTGEKAVTILGVSGEVGRSYDNWWRNGNWDLDAYKKAHEVAQYHRDALQRGLENSTTETVVVVSHRSIVPDTIGSKAKEIDFVSAQTQGFADIIDKYVGRRSIIAVSGHDHDKPPWQGYPFGTTREGRPSHNVSAPVRRRLGMPLAQTLRF